MWPNLTHWDLLVVVLQQGLQLLLLEVLLQQVSVVEYFLVLLLHLLLLRILNMKKIS